MNNLEQETDLTTEVHTQSGQQTSPCKLSYQPQNRDTAFYFDRSAFRLPETPLARPTPEPPPDAGEGTTESDPDIKTKTESQTHTTSSPRYPGLHRWTSLVDDPLASAMGHRRATMDPNAVASMWTPNRTTWTPSQMASHDFNAKTQAKATTCPDHGQFTSLSLTRPSLWTSDL